MVDQYSEFECSASNKLALKFSICCTEKPFYISLRMTQFLKLWIVLFGCPA